MKLCSKCLEVLPFDSFFKCSKSKSGFQSQCKMCKVISVKSSPSQTKENKRLYDMSRKTPKHRELKRAYHHKNKVKRNISRRIRHSLNGKQKSLTWELLVGYSLTDLKNHLQSMFRDGMTWDNYGSLWHIDHIKPISKFNIVSDSCSEFKECWSLNNLQPLLAIENLRKSNSYTLFD